MVKKVVVIASGETERRSLPHLLAHLGKENISVREVLIPAQHRDLLVSTVVPIIHSAWFQCLDEDRPDKFVVLKDVDGKEPDDVLRPLREQLPNRLHSEISVPVLFAFAQWHLEAWFFADAVNLRKYLSGRELRRVNESQPDEIRNPKQRLKNLLVGRNYTSVVSEEIASQLNPSAIAQRSPSFRTLLSAMRNGAT